MHSLEHEEGPGQSANFSQVAGKPDRKDRVFILLINQLTLGEGEKTLKVAKGRIGVERSSSFSRTQTVGFLLAFAKTLVLGQRCLGVLYPGSALTGWKKALVVVPGMEQSHTSCELDVDVTQG